MIRHNQPTLGSKEIKAAKRAITSGWVLDGHEVKSFENELAEYFQITSGGVLCFSSGSAALYVALTILQDIELVHLPIYTCSAVSQAARLSSKKIVFLDNEKDSPNATYSKEMVDKRQTAIIVDTFGRVANMDNELVGSNSIEDISQAFGASVNKTFLGSRTRIGVGSLSATKIITSGGQGGFLILQDSSLLKMAEDFRNYDGRHDKNFRFNFKMTEIQAAIGRVQLSRLSEFLDKRHTLYSKYCALGVPLLQLQNSGDIPYRAVLKVKDPKNTLSHLERHGIRGIVPYQAEEFQVNPEKFKNATDFARSIISLPIYPSLTLNQVSKISNCIRELLNQ
jgi:perosamine synthetase